MSIYAVMVVKDEADRYLRQSLVQLSTVVDRIFVYDDGSTDGSQDIARQYAFVWERDDVTVPSFMEDESVFRSASYAAFDQAIKPSHGDWVLSIDADEMLVADGNPRDALMNLVMSNFYEEDPVALSLRKAEVFGVDDGVPLVRTDGYWGDVYAPRFFRWNGEISVPDGVMGSGSIPEAHYRKARKTNVISLLHYGYATMEDRVTKYGRYFGRRGHNPHHINSILKTPKLAEWEGPVL